MAKTGTRRLARFLAKLLFPLSDAAEHWAVGLGSPPPRAPS